MGSGSDDGVIDFVVLPLQRWSWVAPAPEEDVAVRMMTLTGIMTRETFLMGCQTMRGSVRFGSVHLVLVQRERAPFAWPDTPYNPFLYLPVLVLRGSIAEVDGKTHVKLWVYPGAAAAAGLAAPTGFAVGFGYAWFYELVSFAWVAPSLVVLALLLKWFFDLRRELRSEVARALGV